MTKPTLLLHAAANTAGVDVVTRLDGRTRRRHAADLPSGLSTGARSTPAARGPTATDDSDEAPYRVLVVEDDPSQALFAEGVLRGAGIHTCCVRVSAEVMPAMDDFRPDLVLMDLHMPLMSGTQLTTLIRAHPAFTHTPIVFLTGDQDPERQFEALELGADDFLSKPIRPRHLMAAVHSRIKRARTLARQREHDHAANATTGLYHRPHVLRSIGRALADGNHGGALFVDVRNAPLLRERYGYAGFEQLLLAAGQRLAHHAGTHPCARLGDNAFLVFAPGVDAPQLETLARALRDGIRHAPFDYDGMPQRLDVAIGCASLSNFNDSADLLDALGRATHEAQAADTGIVSHIAPPTAADHLQALVPALQAALASDGLDLAYQPVVAVAGGDEAQFQVLLRMRDAAGTVHPAGALVPAAESAGLMPDIDRWVLEHAIGRLQQQVQVQREVRLFVSQSPRTLVQDAHAQWLLEQLDRRSVPGSWLIIDLRLDDALLHQAALRRFIEPLLGAGVRFCLNQYAHAADADALLDQLPLGYLRLSPRYSGAHSEQALRDELRRVIDRAHGLGLQVIGPQVENAQSAAMLWMSGIDLIQGNLVQQADEALDFDFRHAVL
jgi:PleD family two-component response regulator/EAL domain-containing protein (putative c-di-GMP-specific phosphodiesterase class I)